MGTKQKAQEQGKQMAEKAQEKTGEMTEKAREQARAQASQQKTRAAEGLSGIAHALHETSDNLRHENQPYIAQYVDEAGRQIERASGYLSDHSTDDMVREAERFARREPALFLGGAFALGLLGARFLKSSNRGSSPSSGPQPRESRHTSGQRSVQSSRAKPVRQTGMQEETTSQR